MKKFAMTAVALACGMFVFGGAARADEKKGSPMLFRASALHLPVTNAEGEDLGKITDWTIRGGEKNLNYGILTYGGVAGVGAKMFAVPFEALTLNTPDGDPAKKKWVVKARKADLDTDPGFKSDALPTEANGKLFGKEGKKAPTPKEGDKEAYKTSLKRLSELDDLRVKNKGKEDLGRFVDWLVDAKDGRVIYAALSFGGVAGVGDKLFAVPCEVVGMGHEEGDLNKVHFIVEVPKDTLKNSEGFNEKNWPAEGNADFKKFKDAK